MYTSFLNNKGGANATASSSRGFKNRNIRNAPPTRDELQNSMQTSSLLKLSQRILGGKAVVKHVLCDSAFVIYHEDFRQEFVIRQIPDEEDITKWIDLQTHTNITTAFDSFKDEMSGAHFSMVESNSGGNIFQHIKRLNLNLGIDVPRSYIETIYDVAIQLAQGMDFAHNSGLVHGQFDLSKVVIQAEDENIMYKITDFAPYTSMQMPLSSEASYWPFSKQKKQISDREKMEVIMLKDIYTLGISILELMIGRTSKSTFSISLDSLPLTWAEFPESTPLIQVLVECIQIDSITQRKGRLQGIKKLLIREYKKFFQKPIYKMESPFLGKKADTYNKKGIVALFHNKEGEALHWWSQARILSDRHFDSQCNFCMHRWSTGRISDLQLIAEMEEFIFGVKGKGKTLHAYLLISMGEREQGMQILKQFIAETDQSLQSVNRNEDLKTRKLLKQAQEVFNVVQLNKTQFFNNVHAKHDHQQRITDLCYSENSLFMVSISTDMCKVWKIVNNLMGTVTVIPGSQDNEHKEDSVLPVATVDNNCSLVATYKGKLHFQIYKLGEGDNFKKQDTINLRREIIANGINDFNFTPQRDKVTKLCFLGEERSTHLRIFMVIDGQNFYSDVQLNDNVATLKPCAKYFDMPILNVTDDKMSPQIAVRQENVRRLIDEQNELGNELIYPSQDMRLIAVYNAEDKQNKFYRIYDNLRNEYIRKVAKKTMFDEAVAINCSGTMLAFVEDTEISVRSIRFPNNATLIDNLRPRIAVAESKLNPAQSAMNRQTYKDKLYRELHAYHMFKENPVAEKALGLTEEQNVQLMVLKYEDGVQNKYKLKANRELMMLQKVLLRDAVKTPHMRDLQVECPLVGVEGVKRIEIYDDELTFKNDRSKIDHVAMSSEPHRNFFLIAMDKLVYKYDLVSKELLFQFQTNAETIKLYDKDDKLIVASDNEIRLWDFYDHKEEAPELITAMQITQAPEDFKVQNVFINKNSKCDALWVLVTFKYKFIVYTGRLQVKYTKELDDENEYITAGCFSEKSDLIIIGTTMGRIHSYKVSDGEPDGQPHQAVSADLTINQLVTLNNIEENEAYIMVAGGKDLSIYIRNKKEDRSVEYGEKGQAYAEHNICNVQVASNNKFFMIGIPAKRAIGFFGLNRLQLSTKPLMWINKYPFENFYADDHLSTMMLIDDKHRALDFQYILWRFDTEALDKTTLNRLDAGPGGNQDEDEDMNEMDSQGNEVARKNVENIKGSSCCTIF